MINFKYKKFLLFTIWLSIASFVALNDLYARGGGGGGHSSSHSSGSHSSSHSGGSGGFVGGSSGISSHGGGNVSFVVFIILFIIFFVLPIYLIVRRLRRKGNRKDELIRREKMQQERQMRLESFKSDHPDFQEDKFLEKVQTAFMGIQNAWSAGEMSPVRRFISDGVYQRYHTQLEIMQLLKQSDKLDKIQIHEITIDNFQSSGNFDVIQVKIDAQMEDRFLCEMDSSLNEDCDDAFVEYWSFIRKKGIVSKDLYTSAMCPSCGAKLKEGMGEVARCEYCNAIINSGDYDWVLSEITQEDDYTSPQSASFMSDVNVEIFKDDPDFSIQEIEDKVSNGYLQLLSAGVFRQPERMRRFVSSELYEKLKNEIPETTIAYNRLFLNEVSVIDMKKTQDMYDIKVFVRQTYEKVELQDKNGNVKLHRINKSLESENVSVSLSRKAGKGQNKGSVYAHICPSCGGNIKDTSEIKCEYCGTPLNSVANDWIINGLETLANVEVNTMSDDSFVGSSFVGGAIFSDYSGSDSRDDDFSGGGGSFGGGGASGDWDSDSGPDSSSDSDSSDSGSDSGSDN
jgi:predicted lipid-binding transport protein (Tim44 family)